MAKLDDLAAKVRVRRHQPRRPGDFAIRLALAFLSLNDICERCGIEMMRSAA